MSLQQSARRALRASVVVSLAVGCRGTGTGGAGAGGSSAQTPPPAHTANPYIHAQFGSCTYGENMSCPEGVSCNPPPPRPIDCPPEARSKEPIAPGLNDAEGMNDDFRPPDRQGWHRVRRQFHAGRSGCWYTADHYCPPKGVRAWCDPAQGVAAKCTARNADGGAPNAVGDPPQGLQDPYWIEPFVGQRAGGRCEAYPGFWCGALAVCALPKGTPTDCPPSVQRP